MKISVCIATYNGSKYIREQLDSILSQISENDEVIISDDGSTDETLEIIESYNDKRIQIFHHNHPQWNKRYFRTNAYVSSNFENAIAHSSGDLIFLSDQDDIWSENKVKETCSFVLTHPGGVYLADTIVVFEDGSYKKDAPVRPMSFLKGLAVAKYLGSSMALDRSFLEYVMPFPKNNVSHDAWIGLMATYQKKLYLIHKPLLKYRRHSSNVTSNVINSSITAKLSYRLKLLVNVIKRNHFA
jgi:glycosyltransferase involved in cell wall biosynthesis